MIVQDLGFLNLFSQFLEGSNKKKKFGRVPRSGTYVGGGGQL